MKERQRDTEKTLQDTKKVLLISLFTFPKSTPFQCRNPDFSSKDKASLSL